MPQKLLEESGEPPPVPRIAKEARPRPVSDASRGGSGSKKQQAAGRGRRGSGGVLPARAAPRRAASAGVANAVAAAAHRPVTEPDSPRRPPTAAVARGADRASAAVAPGAVSHIQQQGSGGQGDVALHALLAMQQAPQGAVPQHPSLLQRGVSTSPRQLLLSRRQLVRMPCKIW